MLRLILSVFLISFAIWSASAEVDKPNKKIVRLSVENIKEKQVAKISEVKDKGVEYGINNMKLIGNISDVKDNGTNQKNKIQWHSATLNDKTIPLSKTFESDITVKKEKGLEVGDKINAIGDPQVLVEAYEALKKQQIREDKKENIKQPNYNSTNPSFVGGYGNAQKEKTLPEIKDIFTAKQKPVVLKTTDGCEIKVDLASMKAIVQEQTLIDGVPQNDCKESTTIFPIVKDYDSCGVNIKIDEGRVYNQYKLNYTNNSNGSVIPVEGCKDDLDQIISIEETTDGCKVTETDVGPLVYKRRYYVLNGRMKELAPGCYAEDNTNFHTEDCEDRYTHFIKTNENGGYSKINKSTFYIENGQKIYVGERCTPSGDALEHFYKDCGYDNNDLDKISKFKVSTYIKDQEKEILVEGCKTILDIPYSLLSNAAYVKEETQSGARIHLRNENIFNAATNNPLIYAGDILNYFPQTNEGYGTLISRVDPKFKYHAKKYNFGELKASYGLSNGDHGYSPYITDVYEYCLMDNPRNSKPWIANGTVVNDILSDQLPYWKVSLYNTGRTKDRKNQPIFKLDCTEPKCDLVTFNKYKTYKRGDGSLFINKQELIGKEKVCGTGTLLDELNTPEVQKYLKEIGK
ncbi:MAG: hypothetical protein J0H68_09635 [Sphingobacteriia bacterium]|nr:hypothetical protein [Sphingobacteriia bacterium]